MLLCVTNRRYQKDQEEKEEGKHQIPSFDDHGRV